MKAKELVQKDSLSLGVFACNCECMLLFGFTDGLPEDLGRNIRARINGILSKQGSGL